MTTDDRTTALQHLARRHFAVLLPLGGLALLAACSKSTEPAAPTAAQPAPAPSPAPMPATDTTPPATAAAPAGAGNPSLPMVDPADPSAKALSYAADASEVVAASNPKYQPGQACSNCLLYAGQPGDAAGPCPLFAGRLVGAKAWCITYAKKAG